MTIAKRPIGKVATNETGAAGDQSVATLVARIVIQWCVTNTQCSPLLFHRTRCVTERSSSASLF